MGVIVVVWQCLYKLTPHKWYTTVMCRDNSDQLPKPLGYRVPLKSNKLIVWIKSTNRFQFKTKKNKNKHKEIPPYFKNQSVPIVSYSYTNSIGRTIFKYKEAFQDINIEEYLKNPLTCDCSHSPCQYIPSGHVITGDLNIIQHESLRKVISHGPKFREPEGG